MQKKTLFFGLLVLTLFFFMSGPCSSAEMGPADITLKSSGSKKKPPSVFPHKKHQDAMECGVCHHGMENGKQTPYTDGMAIQKCEECHNPKVLQGKKKGKLKLDTFEGAGHGKCRDCHREIAKKDTSKKKLKSCKTCHKK